MDGFEAFAVAVAPRLLRRARLLTGDPHLAEDLMQATLLKVYLRWGRSGRWADPGAYALRVLYTTFCGWRSRRWTRESPTGAVPDVPGADPYSGSDTGTVDAALRALPPRQRAVLVARFYEDLTVDRTAELLGCSPGTVKSQTAHGLGKLRAALTARDLVEEKDDQH